jgi:hypothetical protein
MSQLQVNRINDASGGVLAPISSVMRNRIINGAMVISQRNGTSSVTPDNSYTLDRWSTNTSQASKFTVQQNAGSVTPPTGFANYLGVTSSSAYSVGVGDVFTVYQNIEGFNTADLDWGTANAKTITISFWVRSSLTGTFGGALVNSAEARSYPFSYTISSANTWEQKTITIAGDTSGTWVGATNGIGLRVRFGLGAGSTYSASAGSWQAGNFFTATGATSVVGTNGATFYITGVQLEVGTQATSFEYRQYQQELALCQRYYYRQTSDGTTTNFYALCAEGATNGAGTGGNFPVPMRTVPTPILGSGIRIFFPSTSVQTPTTGQNRCSSTTAALVVDWTGTSATLGQAGSLFRTNSNGFIEYSAEL